MLKADFHVHTKYSMDCHTSLEEIIKRCLETEINCVAIADHDAVEGGKQLQKLAPFPVIVAEEILTPNGEIMGMFLEERIPSGVSIEQAISRIKEQGGMVCLPHPFDTFRGLKLEDGALDRIAEQIDIVETFNARSPFLRCYNKACAFATKYDIPVTAGSDAHSTGEIGNTYIEMPEFSGRDDFLEALRKGRMQKQRSGLMVHLNSTFARLKKSI